MIKTLRPYQQDAVDGIINSWKEYRTLMCVVATGGGKTLIAAEVANRVKDQGKVLFLANRNELCEQPLKVFHDQCNEAPGLEKAFSRAPLDSQIVIGSVQTLAREVRLNRFPADHFDFIFADEAHSAASESWKRIFDHFPFAKICGITATPMRSDNKKLSEIFSYEAFRLGLFDLVDQGYLVSPDHVDRLETAISLANVRVKQSPDGKDYDLNDAHDAIVPWFDEIAKELVAKYSDRHILAFLPLVRSSEKFVAACKRAGLNAVHIDGNDPERGRKLQAFKDGQIQLLCNSNLLHTGIDMPICDCTLNLRPTRSRVLYQQIVGRSTRTIPGLIDGTDDPKARLMAIAASSKPCAYILDPLWLTTDHDLVTPAVLIAQNQEMVEAINSRAGKHYQLRLINREIEEEREEAILQRLEAVAQFRDGRLPKEYFAAAIKDRALSHYEAVYEWERSPLRAFTRILLQNIGIDPDSVATEGEALAVRKAVYRRRYHGLADVQDLAAAVETGMPPDQVWRLTKAEARRIARDHKHAVRKLLG